MRHQQSRNPGRTDTDLELERRGKMSDLTAEERSAFILVAERLGCTTAAQHIRDDQRRRDRVHAAPAPAPRPGPKPRITPPTPPLMWVLPPAPAVEDDRVLGEIREQFADHAQAAVSSRLRGELAAVLAALAHRERGRPLRSAEGHRQPGPPAA